MNEIRITYTLICDGTSDQMLIPIINWLLNDLYPEVIFESQYADFSFLSNKLAKGNTKNQIALTEEYYPCDILFYHRDAEKSEKSIISKRENEILMDLEPRFKKYVVPVIPVRMSEAWLLIDADAIRFAVANRGYKGKIALPKLNKIEEIADPKLFLKDLLIKVSEKKGRNLKKFNWRMAIHLLAANIEDFTALRSLEAFQHFEATLKSKLNILIAEKHGQKF